MKEALDLRVKRPLRSLDLLAVQAIPCESAAIREMLRSSGLQDKSVAIEIEVDNATLSKAQNGQARLSEEAMDALMDACGSEAWLMYWLVKRGYDPSSLRRIESDVERENRQLREQVAKLQEEREIELRLFSKLRAA